MAAIIVSFAPGYAAAAELKQPETFRILAGRFSDATPMPAADIERNEKDTSTKGDQQGEPEFEFSGRKVNLEFENSDLRDLLELLVEVLDLKAEISDDVHGAISVRAMNMPADRMLAMIFERPGLDSSERPEGRVLQRGPGYTGRLDGLIRVKGEKPATRDEVMKRYKGMISVNQHAVTWTGKAIESCSLRTSRI